MARISAFSPATRLCSLNQSTLSRGRRAIFTRNMASLQKSGSASENEWRLADSAENMSLSRASLTQNILNEERPHRSDAAKENSGKTAGPAPGDWETDRRNPGSNWQTTLTSRFRFAETPR